MADAAKQGVKPKDDDELARTLPMLTTQLRALVARDLFDMSEYFQIVNEESDIVRAAIKEIEGKEN